MFDVGVFAYLDVHLFERSRCGEIKKKGKGFYTD